MVHGSYWLIATLPTSRGHLQVSVLVTVVLLHSTGTLYGRFGSLSQCTLPLLPARIYLYSKLAPAGSLTVAYQRWLLSVYLPGLKATALLVSQFPRAPVDPTSFTLSPHAVVAITLNVTSTDVGVLHTDVVFVPPSLVVGDPDPLVKVLGQFVFVAVL